MIIDFDQTFIYEIIGTNQDKSDMIVEYLIEVLITIKGKSFSYNTTSLNQLIFKYLSTNGIKKLIIMSKNNFITIDNNISLKFHPINKLHEQNTNSEKIIAVNFRSSDQNINFPMAGKSTDTFSNLEERLYNEFPELRNQNIYFVAGGNVINKEFSLEQNQIKNGNTILILKIY